MEKNLGKDKGEENPEFGVICTPESGRTPTGTVLSQSIHRHPMADLQANQPRLLMPNEIWLLILTELTAPDNYRNYRLLYPLLLVSHQLYNLTIPMLYENIRLVQDGDHPQSVPFTKRLDDVQQGLSNKVLAAYTTDLVVENTLRGDLLYPSATPSISQIIGSLPNLRRLRLALHRIPDPILKAIPPSVTLTHLSLNGRLHAVAVQELLESQMSLEHLDLASLSLTAFTLSKHALPRLKTFIGHARFWADFAPGRPVIHLDGRIVQETVFHNPARLFAEVRSLQTLCRYPSTVRSIAPYLQNIEQLSITVFGLKVTVEDFSPISSTRLRYLRIFYWLSADGPPSELLKPLFERFPSLRLIDVPLYQQRVAHRLTRNAIDYKEVTIPEPRAWECWWESVWDTCEDLG